MATSQSDPQKFLHTSGVNESVWVHLDPPSNRPTFSALDHDLETEVCIVGAGIAGISTAYELVSRGHEVTLVEAREVLSGETGRTSGHLSNALDDGYVNIKKKHGQSGAQAAADSHTWAINRVAEIAKSLNIECEYRKLPAYEISQYPRGDQEHDKEVENLKAEVAEASNLGLDAEFRDGLAIKGWDGSIDQRDGAVFNGQATFHPTKYLNGVLHWLKEQPKFQCFTHTRVVSLEEKGIEVFGIGNTTVQIQTEAGHTIKCGDAVEATCVPLQKLSVIAEMEYNRTYCIAMRLPKGYVEDCLIYDEAEEYKYVRLTACDDTHDYIVVGGCDHKVGQDDPTGRFEELENWTRERFKKAGPVDYKWSGQIFEPVDYMAFIGLNQGMKHTYIVTGDSGNGLTHGVLAGKLISDEIEGVGNPWSKPYSPSRLLSIAKSLPTMLGHDIQINMQYKRFLESDLKDIEDLVPGSGGVLNPTAKSPIAVYKDDDGKVEEFSALCPHLKGVVCWNSVERSFDCPVHGSRFSKDGICIQGPAKANLSPVDRAAESAQGVEAS
ncbi:DAO-domain-containing protein [Rhizodiscina lignyota]|uniref:DAO-domain-containing protein n=1 Tax=Rhizodiscina lignyota TaxID=1504668 RepID=A0A9P4IF14_9PEZI|nr:DAO-domain-containing protein [Rhizodiscina lignyota]